MAGLAAGVRLLSPLLQASRTLVSPCVCASSATRSKVLYAVAFRIIMAPISAGEWIGTGEESFSVNNFIIFRWSKRPLIVDRPWFDICIIEYKSALRKTGSFSLCGKTARMLRTESTWMVSKSGLDAARKASDLNSVSI